MLPAAPATQYDNAGWPGTSIGSPSVATAKETSANTKTRLQLTPTSIPKTRRSRIEEAISSSGVPGHEQHRSLGVEHDLVAHAAEPQLRHFSPSPPADHYEPRLLLLR